MTGKWSLNNDLWSSFHLRAEAPWRRSPTSWWAKWLYQTLGEEGGKACLLHTWLKQYCEPVNQYYLATVSLITKWTGGKRRSNQLLLTYRPLQAALEQKPISYWKPAGSLLSLYSAERHWINRHRAKTTETFNRQQAMNTLNCVHRERIADESILSSTWADQREQGYKTRHPACLFRTGSRCVDIHWS